MLFLLNEIDKMTSVWFFLNVATVCHRAVTY